jgi:hypothetical protein
MPDCYALKKENEPSPEIREIKEEIWVTIGKRKGFSELELHTGTAFKHSARRAALSVCVTGPVFLSPPMRGLCNNKKLNTDVIN